MGYFQTVPPICVSAQMLPPQRSLPWPLCLRQYPQSLPAWGFPVAQMVKNMPAMQETGVQSLGWEDPLEKGMATHSNILAWRILWTEELGGLQSMRGNESNMTERLSTHTQLICSVVFIFHMNEIR